MNKRTAAALEKSIEHWKRMLALESPENVSFSDMPIGQNCALCKLFVYKNWSCYGCPIEAKTGIGSCGGTPYERAHDAFFSWRDGSGNRSNWRRQASRMIKFLESLREQE